MPKNKELPLTNIPQYNISKKEYKIIDTYIQTLDPIETFDILNLPIPKDIVDIDKYKKNTIQKTLRKPSVALVLRENAKEVMSANTASAQEVLFFFSQVMRGEVKDQFGLDAPLSERLKAAIELAKRTVDLENKANTDPDIHITLNWTR